MPDVLELILRDIKNTIFDYCQPLDSWNKQEIEYISPNNYKNVGLASVIKLGDEWDNSGKNFYFTRDIIVPDELLDKKVYLELEIGGESAVYVNGKLKRGLNERFILLDEKAEKNYQITIEATYHIHDFNRYERKTEKPYYRHFFEVANLVLKNGIIDKYYILLKTTIDTVKITNSEKYRGLLREAIDKSLKCVNFHTDDRSKYIESIKKANQMIEKCLSNIKANYPGKVHLTGNSHIDVAFKWPIKETIRKCKRTFSTAVELMEQYEDFYYTQSQPLLYKYVKDNYPDLYRKIKEKVKEGSWELIGGMWVEPDTNLPSGESLVRQLLYGQKFYKEEFNIVPEICWLPDTFGFSASLPQILKKSGINYFATTKIRQNDTNTFPYNVMRWQGNDGSQVAAYQLSCKSTGAITPESVKSAWDTLKEKELVERGHFIYGYGDGGGGATADMLETMQAMKKIPVLPEMTSGKVADNLPVIDNAYQSLPLWQGEIYFERHRGVYTSQAILKKYNRQCEFLYREAEIISSIASIMGADINTSPLEEGWEKILTNQFHDILPGSCIRQALYDAIDYYQEIIKIANEILEEAYQYISASIECTDDRVIVYNLFTHNREDIVCLELNDDLADVVAVRGGDGRVIPVQKSDAYLQFIAEVPSLGYNCYSLISDSDSISLEQQTDSENEEKTRGDRIDNYILENNNLRIVINKKGNIDSIFDKFNKREILSNGKEANQLQIFVDKSTYYDTWDLNISEDNKYIINDITYIRYQATGPVYHSVLIKKTFNKSAIEQEIILYQNSSRIDFKTKVDWQERQMLLKAAFPVDISADKASYDIAFGNIERPIHKNTTWQKAQSEVSAHKWVDLSEYGYGVSILNDCKYGYDIKNNQMRITLLKGGIYPDPEADLGEHHFTYSLYPHQGDFRTGGTIQEALNLNHSLQAKYLALDTKLQESNGILEKIDSFLKIDQENIILEALKKAEDGDGYILRVSESYGMRSKVMIDINITDIKGVFECDLMENVLDNNIEIEEKGFSFTIKPYEVKTFRIRFK